MEDFLVDIPAIDDPEHPDFLAGYLVDDGW